jgi:hypothetical protein
LEPTEPAGFGPIDISMVSFTSEVVILCWGTPTKSDRNAHKIATFLGADATSVSLSTASLGNGKSIPKSVSRCACLIVDAETLAKAADAMAAEFCGLRALTDWAEHVFIYGFRSTDRHGAILQNLSSGALLGVQPLPDTETEFHVAAGHRECCGQFSGLSFQVEARASENSFLESTEPRPQAVIIRAGDKPFLVRTKHGRSQVFFAACGELADLDEGVKREVRSLSWFSRLVPLMMFLRGALGNRLWRNDHPRACFIIDDPLLRDSYGFLEYRRLAEIMRRHRFCTSIAFIPWNYRRSSRSVAELFSSNDRQASLCIHGCDHTGAEFATTDVESLRGKAQLALERMQAHRRFSGVPFDDVMVFPQGLFSVEAMMALKASGYLAAVNSDVCPSTMPEALTVRDLLDVAVTRFADFPLFGRRYPSDLAEFAFDLFMGKPALAVEHHGYFRNGYKALETFVEQLNSLDGRLEWTDLGTICSCACLTRMAQSGDVHVRFYTSRFSLRNDGAQSRRYLLLKRQTHDGPSPSVTLDGHAWDCEREDGDVKIQISLDAGQTAHISDLSDRIGSNLTPWRGTVIHNARVRIRRLLCEFRDNHVDTNPVLNPIVSTARNFRHESRAASGSVNCQSALPH